MAKRYVVQVSVEITLEAADPWAAAGKVQDLIHSGAGQYQAVVGSIMPEGVQVAAEVQAS